MTQCLPDDWGDGWENVFFNVTTENQQMADERIPLLLDLPFKHKGIMAAPLIGSVSIEKYLKKGQIEQVIAGGENYDGARPCRYEWVKTLYDECATADVKFCFIETGSVFIKDGKTYTISDKQTQSEQAFRSGLQFAGRKIDFELSPVGQGRLFDTIQWYHPFYREQCQCCGSRLICNGCSNCGRCL